MMRRRAKHRPAEIVAKLHDADGMLNRGRESQQAPCESLLGSWRFLPSIHQYPKATLTECTNDGTIFRWRQTATSTTDCDRFWEVRSHVSTGIARVMFTVDGQTMVLLHGF